MAEKHPDVASTRCKYSEEHLATVRALGVDPEWLRTGQGEPGRHLAATPKAEAAAIYRTLTPEQRIVWLTMGRTMVFVARRDAAERLRHG